MLRNSTRSILWLGIVVRWNRSHKIVCSGPVCLLCVLLSVAVRLRVRQRFVSHAGMLIARGSASGASCLNRVTC